MKDKLSMRRAHTLPIRAVALALGIVLATVPAQAATIFGLVDTGELYASVDAGVTWSALSALPVSDAIAIAAAATSDELFLATRSGLVYRSTNGGTAWTAVGSVRASDVADMLILPSGDILLLTATGTLYQSQDNGMTFGALALLAASNLRSLTRDDSDDLYIVSRTGEMFRSTDSGSSWNAVGAVSSSRVVRTLGSGPKVYILTDAGDIAESNDQGVSWTFVGTISQVNQRGLTLNDGMLVAATEEGLVATSNDAVSWGIVGSINQLKVVALGNNTPTVTSVGPTSLKGVTFLSVWPNPVRTGPALLRFRLNTAATISLKVYDVSGRQVAHRPPRSYDSSGEVTLSWSLATLPSGIYFAKLVTDTGQEANTRLTIAR